LENNLFRLGTSAASIEFLRFYKGILHNLVNQVTLVPSTAESSFSRANEKSLLGDTALSFVYGTYASGTGVIGLGLTLGALNCASAPSGDAIEGDSHFLCERERRQIDDELLVTKMPSGAAASQEGDPEISPSAIRDS
jgi:hypothetical protein